jgi:hypothetical protein
MIGPRLQARQAELVEPLADRAFMHLDREPTRHLGPDVYASPSDHIMFFRIRAVNDQFSQFSLLLLRQGRHASRRPAGFQALHSVGVVAVHPIAQGLPVHAVECGRLAAGTPVKNERQSQKTAHLSAVGAFAGVFALGPHLGEVGRAAKLPKHRPAHTPPASSRPLIASNFSARARVAMRTTVAPAILRRIAGRCCRLGNPAAASPTTTALPPASATSVVTTCARAARLATSPGAAACGPVGQNLSCSGRLRLPVRVSGV